MKCNVFDKKLISLYTEPASLLSNSKRVRYVAKKIYRDCMQPLQLYVLSTKNVDNPVEVVDKYNK